MCECVSVCVCVCVCVCDMSVDNAVHTKEHNIHSKYMCVYSSVSAFFTVRKMPLIYIHNM